MNRTKLFCFSCLLMFLVSIVEVESALSASKPASKSGSNNSGPVVVRSFAELVKGTDGFLAVLTAGTTSLAYYCDGAKTAV